MTYNDQYDNHVHLFILHFIVHSLFYFIIYFLISFMLHFRYGTTSLTSTMQVIKAIGILRGQSMRQREVQMK